MTPKLFWHFLVHVAVAAIFFIVVAGIAILLWFLTELMKHYGVPDTIQFGCYWASEGLFFLDLGSLAFVVLVELVKFVRDIWQDAFGG